MKTSIYTQHSEHTGWIAKIAFYKDELSIMQSRIEEIISKNSSKEVAEQIEHFQNQIDIQNNNLRSILHHINNEERIIEDNIRKNQVASDYRKTEDHQEEREMVESFEKNFQELKKELNSFLSKWM